MFHARIRPSCKSISFPDREVLSTCSLLHAALEHTTHLDLLWRSFQLERLYDVLTSEAMLSCVVYLRKMTCTRDSRCQRNIILFIHAAYRSRTWPLFPRPPTLQCFLERPGDFSICCATPLRFKPHFQRHGQLRSQSGCSIRYAT